MGAQVGAPVRESGGGAAAGGTSNGGVDTGGCEWAVLEGHPRGVTALACTTDGGYLLSGMLLLLHVLLRICLSHCRSEVCCCSSSLPTEVCFPSVHDVCCSVAHAQGLTVPGAMAQLLCS